MACCASAAGFFSLYTGRLPGWAASIHRSARRVTVHPIRLSASVGRIWRILKNHTLCYNGAAAAISKNRGEKALKRTISTLLSVVFVLGIFLISPKAEAASLSSKAGIVSTASSRLNVRSGPFAASATVASLAKGSYVTLIARSGNWWQVEYAKGKYGYCHADYIQSAPGSAATVSTSSSSLNVRSGAGTSYARVASLYKNEAVIVLSTSGSWSRILYHGTKTGYASAQYLSTGYTPVALRVPNFKQTDSRWADMQVGSSGKTIRQIGCATTAIAMMESYRTGTTIYPSAMLSQLRYTADGSVYWPSHYVAVTNSSGYLSAIYSQLRAGKPVLFGARNAYGKQHWVVITGFTGGALTASGFTVHDPGSSSRTTLQQFLSAYPTFYKFFYY